MANKDQKPAPKPFKPVIVPTSSTETRNDGNKPRKEGTRPFVVRRTSATYKGEKKE